MPSTELDRAPLVLALQEFYAEVVRVREAVEGVGPAADAPPEDPGEADPGARAAETASRLLRVALERAMAGAPRSREAEYVMAALADEVFLHLDWIGRHRWLEHLLEYRLFRTQRAGDLFFARVDQLLAERDPATREIAAVYLLALGLGFQGKYRGTGRADLLQRYRRELFAFVARRRAELDAPGRHLCEQALAHTVDTPPVSGLPRMRRWSGAAAAAVLLYLLVSHAIWVDATRELRVLNRAIGGILAE